MLTSQCVNSSEIWLYNKNNDSYLIGEKETLKNVIERKTVQTAKN